jgi:hypothetical protein
MFYVYLIPIYMKHCILIAIDIVLPVPLLLWPWSVHYTWVWYIYTFVSQVTFICIIICVLHYHLFLMSLIFLCFWFVSFFPSALFLLNYVVPMGLRLASRLLPQFSWAGSSTNSVYGPTSYRCASRGRQWEGTSLTWRHRSALCPSWTEGCYSVSKVCHSKLEPPRESERTGSHIFRVLPAGGLWKVKYSVI